MRVLLLSITIWAFVVTPSLCEAGLIAHACSDHAGDGCGHEEDCEDDHCDESALRPESSSTVADVLVHAATALPVLALPSNLASVRTLDSGTVLTRDSAASHRFLPLRI